MIKLKTVRFKNILSFGNQFTEIYLDRSKSTLVFGQSGHGKSTLIESIVFGLFGKPFRKINKKTLCNAVNSKDCLVEVELESNGVPYMIRRGIKPDVFEIYQNGNLINQDPSIRDYQKYLDEHILKMNYKTFTQVIVLGYANHTPFMLLTAGERRNMVDELLDTAIFGQMYRILLAKISAYKTEFTLTDGSINSLKSSISVLRTNLEKLKLNETSQLNAITTEIDDIQKEIELIQLAISVDNLEIQNRISIVEEEALVQTKKSEIGKIIQKFEVNKEKTLSEIKFFNDNTACPTCLQEISETHKEEIKKVRSDRLYELQHGINKADEANNRVKQQLTHFKLILDEIATLERQIIGRNANIFTLQKNITAKQRQLSEFNVDKNSIVDETAEKINELETNLNELNDKRLSLIQDRHYYENASTLLKDEGIKQRIIKEYIPIIVHLINQYLDAMEMHVRFEFDENFEERILSRFRDELKYQNLSQGEQARLSLAITLAWRELAKARNGANCNLLILDEIMDASISAADLESVWGIIENITSDSNVFVISHKADMLYDKVHNLIEIKKDGNFSKMV